MNSYRKKINKHVKIKEVITLLDIGVKDIRKDRGIAHSIYSVDSNPSMYIYYSSNSYFCFSQRKGGGVFELVKDKLKLNEEETTIFFETNFPDVANQTGPQKGPAYTVEEQNYLNVLELIGTYCNYTLSTKEGECGKFYIIDRNFNFEWMKNEIFSGFLPDFGQLIFFLGIKLDRNVNEIETMLKTIGFDRRFESRILIPIFNNQGKIIDFEARSIVDSVREKYIRLKVLDEVTSYRNINLEKSIVFGLKRYEKIILVEGIFDMLRLWSVGYTNAVCIKGSGISEKALARIKVSNKVIVMLDNDSSGKNGTRKVVEKLISQGNLDVHGIDYDKIQNSLIDRGFGNQSISDPNDLVHEWGSATNETIDLSHYLVNLGEEFIVEKLREYEEGVLDFKSMAFLLRNVYSRSSSYRSLINESVENHSNEDFERLTYEFNWYGKIIESLMIRKISKAVSISPILLRDLLEEFLGTDNEDESNQLVYFNPRLVQRYQDAIHFMDLIESKIEVLCTNGNVHYSRIYEKSKSISKKEYGILEGFEIFNDKSIVIIQIRIDYFENRITYKERLRRNPELKKSGAVPLFSHDSVKIDSGDQIGLVKLERWIKERLQAELGITE